jgi:hypothetical protein
MFPGPSGDPKKIGAGKGKGFNLNLGWDVWWNRDYKVVGSEEYIFAFERLVTPILEEFKPELTFISAGFDSCIGDQLGGIGVKPSCYAYMTKRLSELTLEKRVIVALEGGYNLDQIALASECVFRALREEQDPLPSFEPGNKMSYKQMFDAAYPTWTNYGTIAAVREIWLPYWPCLNFEKNRKAPILVLEDKVKAWNSNRQNVVGPNPKKQNHIIFEDSNKSVKKMTNGDAEQNFYTLFQTHKDKFSGLKDFFPEVLENHNNCIKFKTIWADSDLPKASLMKVELIRQDGDFNFQMREAIHKINDTG